MNNTLKKPMFTNKELISLIIPMVLEMVATTTIGMADTMMVATAGEASVSAVSLADAINAVLLNMFSAIAAGGAVVSAQYIGNGDKEATAKAKKQILYALFILSGFLGAAMLVFNRQMLGFIYPTAEGDVMIQASRYFFITLISYPFHGIMVSGSAIFRSERNSKVSLTVSLLANLINISGNALLIYGFGMKAEGAAIATLSSRVISAGYVLYLLCKPGYEGRIDKILHYKPDMEMIRKIFGIGIPNGIENSLFSLGRLMVQGVVARFGTSAIAAYAVAMNVLGITNCTGSGMNMAMLTVVGQCVGANDYEQTTGYVKKLLKWVYSCLGILFSVMFIFCGKVMSLFNLSPEAVIMGRDSLRVACISGIVAWPASFTLPQALRAAGDAKFPMVISIASMGLFRVLFSYILGLWLGMGVVGVWTAMCMDWFARGCIYILRFRSGAWKTKRLI